MNALTIMTKNSITVFWFCANLTGWYRQYDAHREDFIERYGESTERWLFHGIVKQLFHFFNFIFI